jgi:hypothetical protein
MATLPELERALVNADKAGDQEAARRLATVINRERERRAADPSIELTEQIPDMGPTVVLGTVPEAPDPTLGDQLTGAGEAALTTVTGATGGTLGMIGGTLKGIAEELLAGEFGTREAADRIEQQAMEGMQALTYAPRTEAGQEIVETIGEVTEPLVAVAPMAAQLQPVAASTRAAAPVARATVGRRVVQPAQQATQQVVERIKQAVPARDDDARPTPGTGTSAGAQAVDQTTLRQTQADELPVPIQLTEGQRTRDFEAQRFERETAKLPEEGAPIRERFEEQNMQLQQNLDEFIDATGAELTELRGVGEIVDKALRNRAANDKRRIRSLYKEAEKAGEMEAPVALTTFIKHLNDSAPEAEVANVLKAVRAKAIQLGAATEGPDGQLVPGAISLKDAELLRRSINNATNAEPTNIRQAAIMKGLIDETTAGLGGDKYRQARRARARYAQDYENIGLVKNLIGLRRGSEDRAIALEDVVRKSILEPSSSLDSVRQLRRLLQTKAGDEGKQAWRELQGATLRHIQDQMLKGVTTNQRGDRIVSPAQLDRAVTNLDKTGKLDFIFGKKGAEQLRTINDVAKTVLTAPPGAVNTSNTATVLAGLMDVALTGTTGVPAPVATSFKFLTGQIKDARLKARIKQSLGE